jgi:hypothetical chaperone protein
MFVGFDYGTSNCAMSWLDRGCAALIPLYGDDAFVPSTLYALERAFIAELIAQQLPDGDVKIDYARSRTALLGQARAGKIEHDIDQVRDGIFFGSEAIAYYISAPGEGYFIKSPKSFLGASGLRQQSIDFFEDVVAAMMLNVKSRAEQYLQKNITQVVIGSRVLTRKRAIDRHKLFWQQRASASVLPISNFYLSHLQRVLILKRA